jgi:hypothetical protein
MTLTKVADGVNRRWRHAHSTVCINHTMRTVNPESEKIHIRSSSPYPGVQEQCTSGLGANSYTA